MSGYRVIPIVILAAEDGENRRNNDSSNSSLPWVRSRRIDDSDQQMSSSQQMSTGSWLSAAVNSRRSQSNDRLSSVRKGWIGFVRVNETCLLGPTNFFRFAS